MTTDDPILPAPLRAFFVTLRQAALLDPAAPETPARARGMIVGAVDTLLGLGRPAHRPNAATRARRRRRADPPAAP